MIISNSLLRVKVLCRCPLLHSFRRKFTPLVSNRFSCHGSPKASKLIVAMSPRLIDSEQHIELRHKIRPPNDLYARIGFNLLFRASPLAAFGGLCFSNLRRPPSICITYFFGQKFPSLSSRKFALCVLVSL